MAKDLENEIKENPANIYQEWDWSKSDFKCLREGNVVYFGHKTAVNIVNNSNLDDTFIEDESSTETKETVTVEEAIMLAKNDPTIQNKIAQRFSLLFYSTPNWGECDGEIYTGTMKFDYEGTAFYELTLMGTISGYTDSYKTDFSYGNKFKINAYVSIYGKVGSYISFLSTW